VDGTRAFIAGLPLWTTLIGLRHQGRPVLGSIGQSYLGELYIGHAGGSRLMARGGRSRPLKVRALRRPDRRRHRHHRSRRLLHARERRLDQVRAAAKLARLGCDAYAYAMVAAGTMDMVIEAGLKSWDIEAAIPVIEGAGGWSPTGAAVCPVGRRHGGQIAIIFRRPPSAGRGAGQSEAFSEISGSLCAFNATGSTVSSNAFQNTARRGSVSIRISWKAPGTST
jgi:hypothetical protein